MSKFKVGDLVIGNEKCYYSITNKTTICKVVKVIGTEYMQVKVVEQLEGVDDYVSRDTIFDVKMKYFKKYRKESKRIEDEIEELERRLKKLRNKAKVLSYNGDILNGKIHIQNNISVDTDKKLLDTIEYFSCSDINIIAEKESDKIKVNLESEDDKIKVKGVAKTHPDDDFDVKIGTELAYYRALEKFYGEKVKRIVKKLY